MHSRIPSHVNQLGIACTKAQTPLQDFFVVARDFVIVFRRPDHATHPTAIICARGRPYLVFVVALLDFELKRKHLSTFIDSCNLVGLPEVNAQYAPFNLFAGGALGLVGQCTP